MNGMPSIEDLMGLMGLTLRSPREGAAEVLRLIPGREALWLMFALVVVLTVIAGQLAALLAAGPPLPLLSLVLLQGGVFLMVVALVHHVGRFFGGQGSFDGALILVTWLQFIFFFVQMLQVAVFVVSPAFAGLIAMLSVMLFIWMLVNFTAELHGFGALGLVFVGVLGTLFAASLILYMIAGMVGFELQMGAVE